MQLSLVLLAAAVGLLQPAAAFKCAIGQYGECYYFQGKSERQSRCAISCAFTWAGTSKCRCPSHYPNQKDWDYSHRNQCISWAKYEGRNKCQDPANHRRDGLRGPRDPETSGLDDRDHWDPEGRDLVGREDPESLEFQDHDLPLSILDGLNTED